MSPSVELSHRDRAILRAVAAGEGELTRSYEPDLYLEGRCCSNQAAVHRLTHAGLITHHGHHHGHCGGWSPGARAAHRGPGTSWSTPRS
jgi:hypothetical protein